MKFYICISLSALFWYALGAIMATGANSDPKEKEDEVDE